MLPIVLRCLTWARKVPTQVWLALLAVAFLAGWLHEHDANVRQQALAASALRAATHERDRLREAVVEVTVQRDQATDSARTLYGALQAKTAFTLQRIVPRIPLPPPSVTPSGDSITFAMPVWEGHLAEDAQRDSALADLTAIARDGLPAIRNQYESALAAAAKLGLTKDSLIANAEARAKLAEAMNVPRHWHLTFGPCYAVGPTGHHGVAACATVGWSPF